MCEHINDDHGKEKSPVQTNYYNLDCLDEILDNFANKNKQQLLLQNNNNNNKTSTGLQKLNNNNNNNKRNNNNKQQQQQQAFDDSKVTDIRATLQSSNNHQQLLKEAIPSVPLTSSQKLLSSSSSSSSSSLAAAAAATTTSLLSADITHILPAVNYQNQNYHINQQQQQQQYSQMSRGGRDENLITCMLITANVGTIFEESTLLELWFEQLKSYLVKIKPQLVAIHCQEVGGKNFETSMKNVSAFTDKILGDSAIIGDYSRIRIFLDENYDCLEKFTALGSLYLVHDSVDNVKLYNFKTAQYDVIEPGRDIFAVSDKKDLMITRKTTAITTQANSELTTTETEIKISNKQASDQNNCSNNNIQIEQQQKHEQQEESHCHDGHNDDKLAEHVEKIKFPIELFPEFRWSRKGFMRTRWLFNDCQPLDLVNIHLFHDASNLVAMKTTPSPYAQNRQKALEFVLQKLAEPLESSNGHGHDHCDGHYNHHMDNNNQSREHATHHLASHKKMNMIPESEQSLSSPSSSPSATTTTTTTTFHEQHEHKQVPLFIFGDFNFRLDTNKVIQRITEGISPIVKKNATSNEVVEFVYHRKISNCSAGPADNQMSESVNVDEENIVNDIEEQDEESPLMTVGKKLFDYRNLDETFRATKNTEWLLELDNELDSFRSQLYEFKISFSPSYPFKEDQTGAYSYMKTRCPAWCDRILFNAAGYKIINGGGGGNYNTATGEIITTNNNTKSSLIDCEKIELLQDHGDVIYRLMGNSVPMGDHKPVLLYCQLNISPQFEQQQQQQMAPLNPSSIKCNQASKQQQVVMVTSATNTTTGAIEESESSSSSTGTASLLESTAM